MSDAATLWRPQPFLVKLDALVLRHLRVARARCLGRIRATLSEWFGSPEATTFSSYGVALRTDFADKTFCYCHYGTYGRYLSDYLQSIETDFAFVDIGANQGLYSLVAANNSGCRQMIAFEPVQRTFDILSSNIALNGAADKAVLLRAAFSTISGETTIYTRAGHSGASTLGTHLGKGGQGERISTIDATGLEQYLDPALDVVIKIDVEGHEAVVVDELMGSPFVNRITAIFYEMDERYADAASVYEALRDQGFRHFQKFGVGRHYDVLATR
ncbi:FkbM family methyltransferase [Sphingomicrobium sp. XHP0239]|uniref:FkbM family methyltransferase n=1 Tax=Sphingomicrobium maritimum TaxID=3133972 RepID=UPI0031CC78E3